MPKLPIDTAVMRAYKDGMDKPLSGADYVRWLQEQLKRRAKIAALHKKGISLAEIGRRFGISRERVRQIVKL